MKRRAAALAVSLVVLAACARLANLESSDPTASGNETKPANEGGGSFPVNDAGAVISPVTLDVTVKCGVADDTGYISIENDTDHELDFEINSPTPDLISFKTDADGSANDVKGTVPARKVKLVHTHVEAAAPGKSAGDIFVTTGANVQRIPVALTVQGGALAFVPPAVDFGQVRQNTPSSTQTVEIDNTGTEDVTVQPTWTNATADFILPTATTNVPAGGKASIDVGFAPGAAGDPISLDIQPTTLAPLCAAPPTLTLKGTRVNQDATVNPGALDFGDVDCGGALGPQALTISNFANNPVTFNAASTKFVVNPSSGTIPAASGSTPTTTQLTVAPAAIGTTPGDVTDTILINIGGAATAQANIAAHYRVVGALIVASTTTLPTFAKGDTRAFTLTNQGNSSTYLRLGASNGSFSLVNNSSSIVIGAAGSRFPDPGATQEIDVHFNETTNGTYTANIGMTRDTNVFPQIFDNGKLCGPTPVIGASGKIP